MTVGQVTAQVFSMASGMVMARYLSKDVYGTYRQLLLIMGYATPLALLGLPASVYFFVNRRQGEQARRIVWQILSFVGFAGILVCFVLLGTQSAVAQFFHNPGLHGPLGMMILYAWSEIVSACVYPLLAASGRYVVAGLFSAASGVTAIMGAVAGVVSGSPTAMVAVMGAGSLLRLALALRSIMAAFGAPKLEFQLHEVRNLLAHSLPLALTGLISTYAYDLDRLFIARTASADLFALYVVGAAEFPVAGLILGSLNTVTTGEFARHIAEDHPERAAQLWVRVTKFRAVLYMPLFFGLVAFSRTVIELLYSEKYIASLSFFVIYQFLIPLRVLSPTALLQGAGLTRGLLWNTLGFGAINLILISSTITWLGPRGAAAMTVLAAAITLLDLLRRMDPVVHKPWVSLAPWRFLLTVTGCAAAAVALWAGIAGVLDLGIPATLLVGAFGVPVTYVVALRLTNVIPDELLTATWIPKPFVRVLRLIARYGPTAHSKS